MQRHWATLLLSGLATVCTAAELPQKVSFNRHIRPILSDKCFTCHGPDAKNRMTPLRLDTAEGAAVELREGKRAIVAGDPDASELYHRVTIDNPAQRMPPAYAGKDKLSETEVALIRRWIEQGGGWEKHWAFIPPERPAVPESSRADWARNPIDAFVLRRLNAEGLQPAPEAPRSTLIRRVTLDLTGLPPEPHAVDAFVSDSDPQAYERVVDRLLESPHYGERMASRWLDAARYADTNGYQSDGERSMWRWRDWVIDAFNRNMPFDRFTVEQLAGDVLPNATRDQIMATGFNRNHRTNAEGGIVDEEFRVEYVADRAQTTSTVWLGLTVGCARCHDHKYDPISQKEFYQLFAYFNNTPDPGFVFNFGNEEPFIPAPTPEHEEGLRLLDAVVAEAEQQYAALQPEVERAQADWERSLAQSKQPVEWAARNGLTLYYPLDGFMAAGCHDGAPVVRDAPNCEIELIDSPLGRAATFDGERFLDGGDTGRFSFQDPYTLAAWIRTDEPNGAILSRVEDHPQGEGYGLYLKDGKIRLHMTKRWTDLGLRLETAEPIELGGWRHVAVTYDGKRKSSGFRIYVDGVSQRLNVLFDQLLWPIEKKEPFRVGAGEGERFQGAIDEVRVYNRPLGPEEISALIVREPLDRLAAIEPYLRTPGQAAKLRLAFLEEHAPDEVCEARLQLRQARYGREEYFNRIPTVMVMKEQEKRRDTFVLDRGAYDAPGEKVEAGVPAVLPPLPEDYPNNRLGFARWLVDERNPLTARVTVNRFWQIFFGAGLVKTSEDFGSQGDWPSHPDLLDWLAVDFMQNGWDMKRLVKTIVTSATYRQSSDITPGLSEKDPENRLLARGPRIRLPAEVIRDQALAVSGLLVDKIGGAPVKPYQPPGLWEELAYEKSGYVQDTGDDLYRRSLYTFWRRTSPPPAMITFDSPDRESCVVLQSRTNTPLQALNLMNDVIFVEASRHLGERMMIKGGEDPRDRIRYAFRRATAREPVEAELRALAKAYGQFIEEFQQNRGSAGRFLKVGESPSNESLDPIELAASSGVASIILNLDEVITKE